MGTEFEKDFDDEVYEDEFYEDGYEGEELVEDDDESRPSEDDDDSEGDDKRIDLSFACEDCDYRWEDQITKKKDEIDDIDFSDIVCPMCGSVNITQI